MLVLGPVLENLVLERFIGIEIKIEVEPQSELEKFIVKWELILDSKQIVPQRDQVAIGG